MIRSQRKNGSKESAIEHKLDLEVKGTTLTLWMSISEKQGNQQNSLLQQMHEIMLLPWRNIAKDLATILFK